MPKQLTPNLSEFRATRSTRSGKCIVGRALEQLGEQDRVNVQAALLDAEHQGWSVTSIVDYLTNRGYACSDHSVRHHRKFAQTGKGCSCARNEA